MPVLQTATFDEYEIDQLVVVKIPYVSAAWPALIVGIDKDIDVTIFKEDGAMGDKKTYAAYDVYPATVEVLLAILCNISIETKFRRYMSAVRHVFLHQKIPLPNYYDNLTVASKPKLPEKPKNKKGDIVVSKGTKSRPNRH